MKQLTFLTKALVIGLFLLLGLGVKAATYYVKPNGSTAWANVFGGTVKELASGNAITAFTTINASATGADTYYFAPGTYNINATLAMTTGQIYGGFSGNESSISDLSIRVTSDLDGNGIVEPWEFTNVVTFTTSTTNGKYSNTGAGNRIITVSGTNGEVNGITFFDVHYFLTLGGNNGVIVLGEVSSTPSDGLNTAKAGKMTQCIVRKIKSSKGTSGTASGIVMLTNANSIIDKCLIEDSRVAAGNGTVYLNKYGGTVSNSVIRNNTVSAYGGAVWLGSTITGIVTDAVVKNCAKYNNTAGSNGGAIRGDAFSTTLKGIQVVNCTVVNNKTTTSSSAAIELVNSGVIANTISLSDASNEVRATQTTNYSINNVYGTSAGTLYPSAGSNNNTSAVADNTFTSLFFKNPTAFQGAVGNDVADESSTYDATKFAAIKAANYYITATSSSASTTYSTSLTLPSSFQAVGGTGATIAITATVPSTDINGDTRNTIGAYNADATAPTVTITSSASNPAATSPIPVTFTFSENVTGFVASDVTVGNGTLSAITAVSAKEFTATITPITIGAVTVDIAAAVVKDGAGNDNTSATPFSITYGSIFNAPIGVTTTAVSAVAGTTATSGVIYTNDGGSAITASGVVWSTTSTPEIGLPTKTTDGSGSITGLTNNTTYFVRAYATNAIGTTYGAEKSFTTKWTIAATANGTNGNTGTITGAGDVANGETVTLTASATTGRFVSWTEAGSVVSNARIYTFLATSNRTLVANFADVSTTYYVRPTGNTTAWTNTTGVSADQIITSTALALTGTATYYFAAGNYTTSALTAITTGKLYGGFTGDETTIDLNARATNDKDGNGLVEPWELTNEVSITSTAANSPYDGSGAIARLLTVTGGEVNGITFSDFHYNQVSGSGPIILGAVNSSPTDDLNIPANGGVLKYCTIRKIKSSIGSGTIMMTNSASVVDKCLIEDCRVAAGNGGAIYMNRLGGIVSNSVLRNNYASATGGALYLGNTAASGAYTGTGTAAFSAIVSNCAVYNNTSGAFGGALKGDATANTAKGLEIVNCTIVNNTTGATGNASVELANSGVLANSIVLSDTKAEIRASASTNYFVSTLYGSVAGGSGALYPATASNNVSGITDAAFNASIYFTAPTTFKGAVGNVGDAGYDATNFNQIKVANFSISNATSKAVTTTSVASLPANYANKGGVSSTGDVTITSTIPTTDMLSIVRTNNYTLGAYEFVNSLLVEKSIFNENNVVVYNANGSLNVNAGNQIIANIKVYDMQGRMVAELKNVKAATAAIANLNATKQVLVVKITSEDNKQVTKKVLN